MIVTFKRLVQETPTTATLYFTPEKPVQYTAGQFLELTVPHDNPDDRGPKRWFTLSSSPSQTDIAITTKFDSQRSSTYKTALRALRPGAELQISDPMGDFVLPKLLQTPIVFVAGGIGITPYLSMLQWLADTGEVRPIRLLQAVSTEDEIAFQPIFDEAKQHATIIVSRPTAAWGGEHGKLTAEMILGLEQPDRDTLVFLSGPEPLVETLNKELKKAGLRKDQLVSDYFPGYPAD